MPDNASDNALRVCLTLLTAGEQKRAGQFRVESARVQFIVAHVLVRLALSAERPHVPPAGWDFVRGPFGKPTVAGPGPAFSLSHTSGYVGCAVAADDIGFDLERWDRPIDLATMDAVLSAEEKATLAAKPAAEQPRHFFDLWTAKEAAAKACGRGLSAGLRTVRIAPTADGICATGTAGEWHIARAAVGTAHLFALATPRAVEPVVRHLCFVELIEAAERGRIIASV